MREEFLRCHGSSEEGWVSIVGTSREDGSPHLPSPHPHLEILAASLYLGELSHFSMVVSDKKV